MAEMNDEFYVGYLPKSPREIARRTRIVVGVQVVLAAIIAAAAAALFRDPGSGVWHMPPSDQLTGVLEARPYPVLRTSDGPAGTAHEVLVVEAGKHGAQERAAKFDGLRVRVTGSLIWRDALAMIELSPDDSAIREEPGGSALPARASIPGRPVTLAGEIVDPKCYLGVMKPGEGKPHKGCAARCIAGGIPPLLMTWDAAGGASAFLLVGPAGEPIGAQVLDRVGMPVQIAGLLESGPGGPAQSIPRIRIDPARITAAPLRVSSAPGSNATR